MRGDTQAARVSMSDFLQNLQVSLADQFSISPNEKGDDFEVVPFSSDRDEEGQLNETMAELSGDDLKGFQQKLRERGSLNAFRMGHGRFLVIDPSAMPALQVMSQMQRAPLAERQAFVRNPRDKITAAIEAEMLKSEDYQALSAADQQEALETRVGPLFLETEEYIAFSERVIGVEVYHGNPIKDYDASGTVWYAETFPEGLKQVLSDMPAPQLQELCLQVEEAIGQDRPYVRVQEYELPAVKSTVELIKEHIADKNNPDQDQPPEEDVDTGPIIVQTAENFEYLTWIAKHKPRQSEFGAIVPSMVRTRLKDHQVESLKWQIDAWKAGLPGVLNADEQGLGKTLQTISFLVWLNEHMKVADPKLPLLIVAPTSLLRNWEEEVERHVERPGLGHLVRLYGSATGARKQIGSEGKETTDGTSRLDLSDIVQAVQQGRGHLTWVLTTYTTLTNYQHSLARIPFAAAVFDEIQNIKNPGTLAAHAARAMNANFRIGLTGTPIENATFDLWAIMDQLTPGALGSLRDFKKSYGMPDEGNMNELYARVFTPQHNMPPLALRRLKSEVAKDLPSKTRLLHPRLMPAQQAQRYDEARIKLASGGMGAALKMLQHIRGVSVHPAIDEITSDNDFITASARLTATFDILRTVKAKEERALVFIEHRKMQYRFIELAKAELGLRKVDMINGETPIKKRQEIVNRFQKHLDTGPNFDLLVLGPKAAGTGLTLTAATHVIHLSRWWNPAVEEQCNDRVHRIGQMRPVSVHLPLAIHSGLRETSFDILLQSLMQRKRRLASAALWPMGEAGDEAAALQKMLQQASQAQNGEPIEASMLSLFVRDQSQPVARHADGSWEFT